MTLRVCAKITSGFVGSAAWPDARHEGGSVSKTIHDRPSNNADGQAPPRPCGLGLLGSLALLLIPYRPKQVCASFAPRQKSQLPPAKSELIFAQTLSALIWCLEAWCSLRPAVQIQRFLSVRECVHFPPFHGPHL